MPDSRAVKVNITGTDLKMSRKIFSGEFAATCHRGVKIERIPLSDFRFVRKMCILTSKNEKSKRRTAFFSKNISSERIQYLKIEEF